MPGDIGGRWTVETLKEHFEQRFADQKEAVAAALAAAEKAVGKAEANAEKWRENANEWRGSMMDREVKFASKEQIETEFRGIRQELASLKETRAPDGCRGTPSRSAPSMRT